MKARLVSVLLTGAIVLHAEAQEVVTVADTQNPQAPSVEDLVLTILDPASDLTIVGDITSEDNTEIADFGGGGSGFFSDWRGMAVFAHGETTQSGAPIAGTLLPVLNQNAAGDAIYQGGIGIEEGIILSTGHTTDTYPLYSPIVSPLEPDPGRGWGVEGPNNGESDGLPSFVNEGETALPFGGLGPNGMPFDEDLMAAILPGWPEGYNPGTHPLEFNSGDATVLEFTVDMDSPGYIRLSFVFASDEYDDHLELDQGFVDAMVVLIDGRNIATFRMQFEVEPGVFEILDEPFRLNDLIDCGDAFFKKNQIAPNPAELNGSPHTIEGLGEVYYNHEYGGFSKVLTRESRALAPGEHHIKIVIQDMYDDLVDSALFIGKASLTLYPLAQGDYNGDGVVNSADYVIWRNHKGVDDPSFREGDGNGDGLVDGDDYDIWHDNYGHTGNRDWRADFNRDGVVNGLDIGFFLQWINLGITQCASRWEGDTNADGAVNGLDIAIVIEEATGGGGGAAAMMGGGEDEGAWQALMATAEGQLETGLLAQLSQQFDALVDEADAAVTVLTAPLAKSLIPPIPTLTATATSTRRTSRSWTQSS